MTMQPCYPLVTFSGRFSYKGFLYMKGSIFTNKFAVYKNCMVKRHCWWMHSLTNGPLAQDFSMFQGLVSTCGMSLCLGGFYGQRALVRKGGFSYEGI
eukprot:6481842-Amphidinium_carterae.1